MKMKLKIEIGINFNMEISMVATKSSEVSLSHSIILCFKVYSILDHSYSDNPILPSYCIHSIYHLFMLFLISIKTWYKS